MAAAFLATGLASELSESELEAAFLAALAAAFFGATTLTLSELSESELLDSFLATFFDGFSTFLALELLAFEAFETLETFEAALGLLAAGLASEDELLDDELELLATLFFSTTFDCFFVFSHYGF